MIGFHRERPVQRIPVRSVSVIRTWKKNTRRSWLESTRKNVKRGGINKKKETGEHADVAERVVKDVGEADPGQGGRAGALRIVLGRRCRRVHLEREARELQGQHHLDEIAVARGQRQAEPVGQPHDHQQVEEREEETHQVADSARDSGQML